MGLYITREDIELTTKGKIRFTDDEKNEERMQYRLLDRLIDEAEADVELALSPRYAGPFQGPNGEPFPKIKVGVGRTAHNLIRMLCRYRCVQHILDTDFGRGSALDGEEFTRQYSREYKKLTEQLVDKRDGEGTGWKYPPLQGLKLAWHNAMADDGFQGMVMSTTEDSNFSAARINDPSENFWNGFIDDSGA